MLMKRQLVNQSLFRGRWFIVTLVFLLLPLGLWAEDYNLTVAGTQVTDENADDVLGDGRVSWNNNTKTLTLENANISGAVVSNVESAITIHLVGTSTITTTEDQMPIQSNSSPKQDLTFTAAEGAMLLTNKTRTDGNADICSGFNFSGETDIPEGYKLSWDADGVCSLAEYYGLYLYTFINDNSYFQPYYVTAANCGRIMGKYNESNDSWDNENITISYDDSKKTLTLDGASPESAAPNGDTYLINCDEANVKNITIMLLGENTLRQDEEWGAGFIKNYRYEGTVTFATDPENPGSLTMPDLGESKEESDVISSYNVIYNNGLGYSKDENNVRYIRTLSSGFGIKVAGVTVTSSNAFDVLDDGTVSFKQDNEQKNVLQLYNAHITSGGIQTSVDLVIELLGQSSIEISDNNYAIRPDQQSLTNQISVTFRGEEDYASLTIKGGPGYAPIDKNMSINYQNYLMMIGENEPDETIVIEKIYGLFGGKGTNEEPYLIKTANELKMFMEYYNEGHFDRNSYIQLYDDIDCKDLQGFTTIADNTDGTFIGVFDGNNKTISNLTMNGFGLFGYVEAEENNPGEIKNLTLENFNMLGDNNHYSTGGIVAELSNGGTISNCTLRNSNISCGENQYNPEVGGIVGRLNGATVSGCVLNNTIVNATTNYPLQSGPQAFAGGVVASCSGGSISNCQVSNGSKVMNFNAEDCPLSTGAIVGNSYEGTYTSNIYTYDVKVETGLASQTDTKETKSGYTHRGTNEETDPEGISMYTKTVILPKKTENDQVTIEGRQGNYYVMADNGYRVAPGQDVTLDVTPNEDGYVITSFTVTNNTTSEQIPTTSTADNAYTFTMPDSDVEVDATAEAPKVIKVARVTVNEDNAENITGSNITGEGTVSFNAETNTLTLTGDVLIGDGGIEWGIDDDLTIQFSGTQNSITAITTSAVYCTEGNTGHQLRLVEGSQSGTCQLSLSAKSGTPIIGNGFTVAIPESSRLVDYDLTTTVQDETYLTRTYTTEFTSPMMYVNPDGDTPQVVIGYSYPGMTSSIAYNGVTFYYSTDGENYSAYSEPIALDNTIDKVYAYAKVRNVQSPTITGKYIHLLDVPTSLVMGETYTPTFTQPTEADGFTFDETKIVYGSSNNYVALYENGVVSAVAIGTATLSINLQEALVMNNNTQQPTVYPLVANDGVLEFDVDIVPEAPAISVEGGTYEEAQRVTLSSDYVRNHPQTASIKYYFDDDSENVQTYSNKTLYIDNTTTLHAWVEVQEESDAPVYKSEVKTESYTILHRADIKWMIGDTDYNYEIDGTTVQADANGNYRDTNDEEPWFSNPDKHEVTFNSTDTSVATVDSEGKITIVGMGKTTISATVAANADMEMVETTSSFTLKVYPENAVFEKEYDLLFPGETVTITCPTANAEIWYYTGNQSRDDAVKYAGPIALTTIGETNIMAFTKFTKNDEVFESSTAVSGRYFVFDEPTFSVASGTYNDGFEVTIGNLPKNDGTVYYYFNDDETHRVEYNAGDKVSVTESTILKAYIEKEDSGQYYKTRAVEAEYVIRQDAGLAYTQNNEAVEVAEYTIGGKDNEDLPELTNANNLAVTYSSNDEQVATIDATGKVTIVGVGETTITATSEQTATLLAGEASYLLTVYKDLSHESITVSVATATYTGEAVEPEVKVMDGETDITDLMNFNYADNIEVGNGASVTIVPNNELEVNFYVGSRTETFSIINRTLEVGKDVTFANGQKWASFYTTTENLELPDGVMAYIVTGVANSTVSVKAINYVPKSVPVLIESESTATTDNASPEGNLLRGTAESTAVSDIEGNVYVLYNGGFTRATSGAIPAHRAYLVLEQNAGARLSIFDETTGIGSMANGQQLKGNDQYYDLQGRKIESHAKKGLYIKNRRKVVVK